MQTMAKKKGSGSRTGLGSIFERVDLSGEAASSSSGSGRSKAVAFKKLKAALVENTWSWGSALYGTWLAGT